MRVVAYNIKEFEKECLAIANAKVHDITYISNQLTLCTIRYASGKDAVIISKQDQVDREILTKLYDLGIKKILTRSHSLVHIDLPYAKSLGISVANINEIHTSPSSIAEQIISNMNCDYTFPCGGTTTSSLHGNINHSKKK